MLRRGDYVRATRLTTVTTQVTSPLTSRRHGVHLSPSSTVLPLLVVTLHVVVVSGLAADHIDDAGPFHSRGWTASNLVGGYLAAVERQHRRSARRNVDVLTRRLGDDFIPEFMSVDRPLLNRTHMVSK